LPITIQQFWDAFMEDNAPCLLTVFWSQNGGKDLINKIWSSDAPKFELSRPDDDFADCFGCNAIKMRCLGATLPVNDIPMIKEARPRKVQALFERTDRAVRFKVTTRTVGVPYSETN
jgi:hypothetical protein